MKPSHFNNWFDSKLGVGVQTTDKLNKWIEKALDHQENPLDPAAAKVFDFDELGVAEVDEEWPEWWTKKGLICEECGKKGATLICVWCEDVYYCNGRCKMKHGAQYLNLPWAAECRSDRRYNPSCCPRCSGCIRIAVQGSVVCSPDRG